MPLKVLLGKSARYKQSEIRLYTVSMLPEVVNESRLDWVAVVSVGRIP